MIKLNLRTALALFTTGVVGLSAVLAARDAALAQEQNPDRNAYFGETHLHTSWSLDAWVFGNRITGPADAYKYAKGETIKANQAEFLHYDSEKK